MQKSGLIRKIRLTSKFMTSHLGISAIAIYKLPNNPKSTGNQTMKFGHLIECNTGNNFLGEKSCTKCGLFPDLFLKNWTWLLCLWIINLKFPIDCFYCMLSWGSSKYIETRLQTWIETKLQTIRFYLIWICLKNKNWVWN